MKTTRFVGAVSALAIGSAAHASMIGPIFTIQATSRLGTSTMTVDQSMLQEQAGRSGAMEWVLDHPVEFIGNYGAEIATLSTASFLIVGAETVSLQYSVTSGALLTTFTVTSALNSFATIDPAEATASAGISITDLDGDGADIFGEFPSGSYQARYNGGTIFDTLISDFSAGPYASSTSNESTGAFAMVGAVDDMQTEFHFSLSANDQAAGTSIFVVQPKVPTPGAGALAFGAFALGMQRRRRA